MTMPSELAGAAPSLTLKSDHWKTWLLSSTPLTAPPSAAGGRSKLSLSIAVAVLLTLSLAIAVAV